MTPEWIEFCVSLADKCTSKCIHSIFMIDGMIGVRTRHLYNNLCRYEKHNGEPTNYLEVGCWKGASTCAALAKNPHIHTTVIDNWCEFGGPRDEFLENTQCFSNITILEEDCFNSSIHNRIKNLPIDIYLYDGCHKEESHEKAITKFVDYFAFRTIVLIDDWSWKCVQDGTYAGFDKVSDKVRILYKKELTEPEGDNGYWNGCGIFLVERLDYFKDGVKVK